MVTGVVHLLALLCLSWYFVEVTPFNIHIAKGATRRNPTDTGRRLSMVGDIDIATMHQVFSDVPHWAQLAYQGLADSAIAAAPEAGKQAVCPGFGEPGWAPFCFLNGNPVFQAFDVFQAFIQSSVVSTHDLIAGFGVKNAYGPSIMLFTLFVRMILLPLNYKQIASSQQTQAMQPKIKEIKEKYPDPDVQNQLVAMLYQESQTNPLAGCLPAIVQIPVFIALYRSFFNLASQPDTLDEPFLWLPNLEGPVFGVRSSDWLLKLSDWHDYTPPLGWHDTLLYLTIPVILYFAQAISLKILTPPSDDPQIQKSQRFLKYLPLVLSYFSLSVPAGLGVYWITGNFLSTLTTFGVKTYLKKFPPKNFDIDIDALASRQTSAYANPAWGYSSKAQMIEEAKLNYRPPRTPKIPADFEF